MEFGIGLWGMQSTRSALLPHQTLYRRLGESCQVAEGLGFESLWLTEHRFWYDGYLPALLTAGGYMAGATTKLRIGTGCLLLPQHDPIRIAQESRPSTRSPMDGSTLASHLATAIRNLMA